MSIVSIQNVTKTYKSGFQALKGVDLEIEEGEILALLGPNGAGKTSLISAVCGITQPTSGRILVDGFDVVTQFREARRQIGLVPQELSLDAFTPVQSAIEFSRGIFGLRPDSDKIEAVLRQLSLWDKRKARMRELSGGMRRRVLIAKVLAHEPRVLFLDEPSAGVDVELRRDMWNIVRDLKKEGATIILTTHYIEEAEAIADRIAVINQGRILLVEEKDNLMARMGRKTLDILLTESVEAIPPTLDAYSLERSEDGLTLSYSYDNRSGSTGITRLLAEMQDAGLQMRDLVTHQSTLEDIFVDLVKEHS